MCGIAGFFSIQEKKDAPKLLKKMADSLAHRGPDAEGFYFDSMSGLAHRRLKIVDLSSDANQPMVDIHSKNILIFNGEIYNFKSLKVLLENEGIIFHTQSDTEVLLKGLVRYGENFITQLEGDFAFAFWKPEEKKLLLCRDRFGVKPLYIYKDCSTIWFASEIKALFSVGVPANLNRSKLTDYFRYRYVPGVETLFENVQHLPPGHFLEIADGVETLTKYYDIKSLKKSTGSFSSTFFTGVINRLVADRPIGLFLSAGIDSSSIAAQISKGENTVSTFSYSFEQGEDILDETNQAKSLANKLNFSNLKISHDKKSFFRYPQIIRSLEEPIGDSIIIANDHLFLQTQKHVTVALSGEGADELFSSYAHHRLFYLIKFLRRFYFLNLLTQIVVRCVPIDLLNKISFYPAKLNRSAKDRILGALNASDNQNIFRNLSALFSEPELKMLLGLNYLPDSTFFEDSIQTTDYQNWLPKYGLLRIDKLSMAHSLEVRVPFLNHRLVESIWNTHWTKPTFVGVDKSDFRMFCKKHLGLGSKWTKRKKQPFFAPSEKIFSTEYLNFIKRTLTPTNLEEFNLLNPDFVITLLSDVENDFLTSKKITAILIFHIWCEQFLKPLPKSA